MIKDEIVGAINQFVFNCFENEYYESFMINAPKMCELMQMAKYFEDYASGVIKAADKAAVEYSASENYAGLGIKVSITTEDSMWYLGAMLGMANKVECYWYDTDDEKITVVVDDLIVESMQKDLSY